MSRVPMTQAVSADYADAMLVARRAKNTLFILLLLILLVQVGLFAVARFVPAVKIRTDITAGNATAASSSSVTLLERKSDDAGGDRRQLISPLLEQVVSGTAFLGVMLAAVLPIILLLVILIMLAGRLVGVSHVTSAFCWSILLLALLFPWQALLNSDVHTLAVQTSAPPATQPALGTAQDVRVPGTLYTFPELRRYYDFPNNPVQVAILGWGRFVGLPVLAFLILLLVQGRSSRGLGFALGEKEVMLDVPASKV